GFRQGGIAMQCQAGTVPTRDRQQRRNERNLIVVGQILFPHAHPAATGRKRCPYDIGERPPRLMSGGDEEERRNGKLHGHSFIVVSASEARTAIHPRDLRRRESCGQYRARSGYELRERAFGAVGSGATVITSPRGRIAGSTAPHGRASVCGRPSAPIGRPRRQRACSWPC